MSKTPKADKARDEQISKHLAYDLIEQLETELSDMREMFKEYVKAEDAWRDELNKMKWDDLRIEAAKLRKQAREVLGL